ncbi:MAG TPA: 6-carboxytetrahydropterin synthase QueD [Acidimicrobiales bacterium]|nr:6-carboxytetrahydropterin synthase QueD [Acidimicrobiales bacterium]
MQTSVTRCFTFEAAHQLPWHAGKCRNLHGHSYRLEVTVAGPVGDQGIVVDFAEIKRVVERDVIDVYDHRYLNDLVDNPTAEVLAAEIWKTVEAADLAVSRIRLWETPDSFVEVTP